MSVSFANAVVAGLRAHGVPVRFWSGWERRGNGQTSAYQGMSWHHTASNYGRAYPTLVNGRAGLSGPLCNSSGDDDGGITIIAAHPANHAGASGGRNMGPLPVTRSFNKHMWGHEIVYPGTKPMTPAQYRSAIILGSVVSKVLRRPNAEWCRGHAETSVTGKWDPGYANGRTYDLNKMRRESAAMMNLPVGPAPSPSPSPTNVPKDVELMRYVNLDNPTGNTPERAAALTIDAVGRSIVMPAGARAWLQWNSFYPFGGEKSVARLEWLVVHRVGGSSIAYAPRNLPHRGYGALELPVGTHTVEIVVRGLPKGGAAGFHIDGIGHG